MELEMGMVIGLEMGLVKLEERPQEQYHLYL